MCSACSNVAFCDGEPCNKCAKNIQGYEGVVMTTTTGVPNVGFSNSTDVDRETSVLDENDVSGDQPTWWEKNIGGLEQEDVNKAVNIGSSLFGMFSKANNQTPTQTNSSPVDNSTKTVMIVLGVVLTVVVGISIYVSKKK